METASPHKSTSGFTRIVRAFVYSIQGLRAAYSTEHSFRQELCVSVILVAVVVALPASLTQKACLMAALLLVLIVELLNSAVEATVDRISLDDHCFSKRAKDIGSAAVLPSILNCLVVWSAILVEVYWESL